MQKRKFTHTQHWTVKNAALVRTSCGDRKSAKQKHRRRPDEYLTTEMLLVLGSPATRRQKPLHGSGLVAGLPEPLLVQCFRGLVIKARFNVQQLGFVMEAVFFLIKSSNL
ncbi:hypothetical protein OROMI_019737 [Orobanche minor]